MSLHNRTPLERTLRHVEATEKAADALMRLGDHQNAIALYAVSLQLRADSLPGVTVTAEDDNPERYRLFRLCDCPTCEGKGKAGLVTLADGRETFQRCSDCRGEGRVRQEIATCASPEAVGVAIVTLAREGEWEECPLGLLDSEGEKGKKWLVTPWLPSARNVTDAARTLAKSKKKVQSS